MLLAEDNLPDALLVKEAIRIEKLPIETSLFADGEKALEFILGLTGEPEGAIPDVIMLDLNLPRVDGMQILERLRSMQQFLETPVLIVTSSDSPQDQQRAALHHAKYFRKPASYDEFIRIGAVLRAALEEYGLL